MNTSNDLPLYKQREATPKGTLAAHVHPQQRFAKRSDQLSRQRLDNCNQALAKLGA